MSPRPITTRQLNRTLLARQSLIVRSRASVPQLLHRVGGLQTQYAPSGYVGLWSRSAHSDRGALTSALEKRSVIQATSLRVTIHMVPARDHPVWLSAVGDTRREWWKRVGDVRAKRDYDIDGAVALVRATLTSGPRRRKELLGMLEAEGHPREIWGAVELWLPMVRVPPSGTWDRRSADIYGLASQWIDLSSPDPSDARVALVDRYLRAYGPTTADSIALWTGLPKTDVHEALTRLDLRRLESDTGEDLVDLPRQPIVDADTPVPIRFLPKWEDILLVHARRSGVISEEHRPLVFNTKMPQSIGTFLVDGVVAGTWKPTGDDIAIEPFTPIPRRWRREVEDERRALAAFHR